MIFVAYQMWIRILQLKQQMVQRVVFVTISSGCSYCKWVDRCEMKMKLKGRRCEMEDLSIYIMWILKKRLLGYKHVFPRLIFHLTFKQRSLQCENFF